MKSNEVIAKTEALGTITRTFKKSMEDFYSDLDTEIKNIRNAVYTAQHGWEGPAYEAFKSRINEEMSQLDKLSKKSSDIAAALERKAKKYDMIMAKLNEAGAK